MENEMQMMPQKATPTNMPSTVVNQTGSKNISIGRAESVKLIYNILGMPVRPTGQRPFNTDYYNLFVLYKANLSDGYFVIQKDRAPETCYTQKDIWTRYSTLTPEVVEEIKTFPTIIANESTDYGKADENQLAICAAITDIRSQENGVKVHFQPLFYLSQNQLIQAAGKLALISGYELNHTHWAIKNMNLFEELLEAKIEFIPLEALSGGSK